MSDPKKDVPDLNEVPEAEIRGHKRRFSFSIVWLVPLVAVLIGGWLVFDDVHNRHFKKDHVADGIRDWYEQFHENVRLVWAHRYMHAFEIL